MAFKFDQSKFMFRAKAGVQQAIASPDLVLVQVVAAIDEGKEEMLRLAGFEREDAPRDVEGFLQYLGNK